MSFLWNTKPFFSFANDQDSSILKTMKQFTLLLIIMTFSALAEIPDTLTRLSQIKDKSSEEYMFLSQQAVMDTKYAAERLIAGENSAGALKVLELGLHVMPHRSDLLTLRRKALGTFVDITQKLEENAQKNCPILQGRYQYLKSIAPDALAKLKFEDSCVPKTVPVSIHSEEDILKIPEPLLQKELEGKFKADLVKTFPWNDVLANSFMLMRGLYGEEFKITCTDFKDKKATCSSTSVDQGEFKEVALRHCGYLEGILSMSTGAHALKCIYNQTKVFHTSSELYQIYQHAMDNQAFDDDIPTFAVLTMTSKHFAKSDSKNLLILLKHSAFRAGKFPDFELKSGDAHFKVLSPETEFSEADLHDVTFTINYKKTFELYEKYFKSVLKGNFVNTLLKVDISK
jgi:hypothetical protein